MAESLIKRVMAKYCKEPAAINRSWGVKDAPYANYID